MNTKCVCILILAALAAVEGSRENRENAVEARGKAKFALLIHFFYVVATKLFVLKLVYGAIFYALIVKGWHFVSWFIHYLKEKHHDHHEYIEFDHGHYHDHQYGPDHGHGHFGHGHDHFDHVEYGHDSYGPYAYKHGYGSDNSLNKYGYSSNKVYDADGSYSVKS